MTARLPAGPVDTVDLDAIDPARRFLPVESFAELMSISPRSAWRLIVARDPRLQIVRLGSGPRPIVRVRLRDSGSGGNT
jgi:hypothetical protein